ncbi:MAG: hypothetical protein AB3N18_08900 [Allomuricauda sp.]
MDASLKYIVLLLLTIALSCKKTDTTNAIKQIPSGEAFVDSLNTWTKELATLTNNDEVSNDPRIHINEKIRTHIENVTSPSLLKEIHRVYKSRKQDFFFILSEDEKFGVFTWVPYTNLSKSGYRNIALYTKNQKVTATSLYSSSTIYDQIHMVTSNREKQPVYVLHGRDKSKEGESLVRLDAYCIKKDGIELTKVFPGRRESIVLTSNTNQNDPEALMDFKIELKGAHIEVPEPKNSTITYRPIKFDGLQYSYTDLD